MTTLSVPNGTSAAIRTDSTPAAKNEKKNTPTPREPRITNGGASTSTSATRSAPAALAQAQANAADNEIDGPPAGANDRTSSSSATPTSAGIASFTQAAAALQTARRDAYPLTSGLIDRGFADQLFNQTNVRVDPEQTWMDEFSSATFDKQWTYQGQPTRSTSLADLVRNGFPADIDWEQTEMNSRAGIFSNDPKTGERKLLPIDTAHLKRVVDGMRPLATSQLEQLQQFWGKDDATQAAISQQSLLTSAQGWQASRALHASGKISDTALGMIRQAAGFAEGQAGDVRSYALDIGGYRAEDIAILENSQGRNVMITPGDPVMFREFGSQQDLRKELGKMARDPATRAQLASHFSLQDWRDSYKAGVGSLLEMMGNQGAAGNIPVFKDRAEISGDVFDWAARGQVNGRLAEAQTLLGENGLFDNATRDYLDRRGAQLFAAPMRAAAGSATPDASAAGDTWLRSLNEALASPDRAAWSRDSAIKEASPTGLRALPAERQRDLVKRHFELEASEAKLAALEPDMRSSAKTYMQEKLRERFNFVGDPDKFALVEYEQDVYRPDTFDTATGRQEIPNPRAGLVHKATPLSQLPLEGMPYVPSFDQTGDAAKNTGRFAVVPVSDIAQRWAPGMSSELPVQALAELVRGKDFDFESRMIKATDDFYQQHGTAKSELAQQQALWTADLMRATGQLSESDYQLARTGFTARGVRDKVKTYQLDIDKRVSLDAMRIENGAGRTLLYLPGDPTPIRPFGNRQQAVDWLTQMHKEKGVAERFVADHFSEVNARSSVAGIMSPAEPGTTPDKRKFLNTTLQTNSDPFGWSTRYQHAQLKVDLQETINSPGDTQTNWRLDALGNTPIPFIPAAATALFAPTGQQRSEGRQALGIEAVTEVATAGAAKAIAPAAKGLTAAWKRMRRVANMGTDGAVEAGKSPTTTAGIERWFKPPQRVNGQLGYPMGPVKGPELPSNDTSPAGSRSPSPMHGEVNEGFAHTEGDTTPASVLQPDTRAKNQLQVPEQIELQDMGNRAKQGNSVDTRALSNTGTQTESSLENGTTHATPPSPTPSPTPSRTPSRAPSPTPTPGATAAEVEAYVDLNPAPTEAQLTRARQIIGSHGQGKVSRPPWIERPEWLTDQYVQEHGLSLPMGAESVDELIEMQKQQYADIVDRQTMRLSQAYEDKLPYSEIGALLDQQRKAASAQKNFIQSQWETLHLASPLTNVDLNGIRSLDSCLARFKSSWKSPARKRLDASQLRKQDELKDLLKLNATDIEAVRARQQVLQKQMDEEVKLEMQGVDILLKKLGYFSAAGLTPPAVAGLVKLIYDLAASPATDTGAAGSTTTVGPTTDTGGAGGNTPTPEDRQPAVTAGNP